MAFNVLLTVLWDNLKINMASMRPILTLFREPHPKLLHPESPPALGATLHEEDLVVSTPPSLAHEALEGLAEVSAAGVRVQKPILFPLAEALVLAL